MKPNEAPEKLYFGTQGDKGLLDIYSEKESDDDIEYTRTDAFIEKACEWIKSHDSFTIGFDRANVRDFLNFINKMNMFGCYYKAGKSWEDRKLWEATKDNPQEDINVESFLRQDNYWNIGSFMELAKEMQLVLKADYSFPIILDEEHKLVDGAHRLVHAYLDGKAHIKGVIIRNDQWPEPDYDELKEVQKEKL